MRSKRILATALSASLLLGATACGDDDDEAATTTTEPQAEGPTSIEVTLTEDGFEGMPDELPAGLVEITLVNESGDHASLDITGVTEGTTEDEFAEGLVPLFEGGPFPDFFESNAGIEANEDETKTSTIVLSEGEHIVWYEAPGEGGDDEGEGEEEPETETETVTETESEAEEDDTSTTVAEDGTTTTTAVEEDTTSTTAEEEQGAAALDAPEGTLTAVAAEDESESETEDEGVDDAVEEDQPQTEEPGEEDDGGEGGEGPPAEFVTAQLTVTAGDASAELPEADGEVVARDYEFEATLDGPGTINFRNEGPQQFHHAVVVDFGTNDPADVEEAFPTILESEGDPSALTDIGDVDMEQVNFDFGGSGVFGPEGAGTFEADIVEGNTYALVCFIQDRTGGPPHAIAYDMWEIVQAGGGDTSTTTEG